MIYETGAYPDQWTTAVIVPIYKKGDTNDPANYRGITLTCAMSKLFTFMLNKRINEWAEQSDLLSQAQFAYKTGYSTTDAVFVLNAVLSSSCGCCGFIDFSKAFDNVNRETLFKTLKQFQISSKLLNLIQNMYSKLKCQVRTSTGESDIFPQSNGVMQGECLSPTLFTAYINEIERLMNDVDEMGVYLNGVKVSVIIYADDLVFISKTKHCLQHGMNALYEFCSANTLTVNTNDSFRYLGVNIHRTNKLSKGLKLTCHQAKKAQSTLDMHISSHPTVSLNHIFKLFDGLIKPVLRYGCAVWCLENIAEIEKCHLQFLKQTLKIKMTTKSCVVYA